MLFINMIKHFIILSLIITELTLNANAARRDSIALYEGIEFFTGFEQRVVSQYLKNDSADYLKLFLSNYIMMFLISDIVF